MILINSSPRDALKIFQPFLPIYVPVGIGCLLAIAERDGITAHVVDEQIETDPFAVIERLVRGMTPPYLFGFSVLTAAFKSAIELSRKVKAHYPDSVICFGGVHPSAAPEEVLAFPQVDVVLRGEGEYSLFELYRAIRSGNDHTAIRGLSYRRDGRIIHNASAPPIMDLDALPLFPYHRFTSPRYDLGFVASSRGCPYGCIFCSNRIITGKRYRIRSAESIVGEIDMLRRVYARRQILFLDDNLLVNRDRIDHLINLILEKGLQKEMAFSFQARGDNVNPELLKALYGAGFRSVFFGLETASERLMKLVNKGETVDQCIEAVHMAKQAGFHVSATFIYALPSESHQDRMDCALLSRNLRLDMVRFNNATPYPGTRLYELAKEQGRLHVQGLYENFVTVSTFIENPFRKTPFSYVPEGNTEDQIRRDILFSYFYYYLDWSRLSNIFSRPDLGVGWFNAGKGLSEIILKVPALVILGFMFIAKFFQFVYYSTIRQDTALGVGYVLEIFKKGKP